MKSLEIIENNIDFNGDIVLLKSKDVETIKQDLEVLEIIKKHLEIYIWQNIFSKEHELELDIILKHIDNEEERYKVKQWFDEQNERD